VNANQARHVDGRYKLMYRCDACGLPIGDRGCTDDEVCQGGDGPGFYLCSRKKCVATYSGKTVEERRALYRRRPLP
jgi:hypothetical protein